MNLPNEALQADYTREFHHRLVCPFRPQKPSSSGGFWGGAHWDGRQRGHDPPRLEREKLNYHAYRDLVMGLVDE